MTEKWGPSIGLFQIRSLRQPEKFPTPDSLRIASDLRSPQFNARAAYAISKQGTDFTKWSTFIHETYLKYKGTDFPIRTGHARAADWTK